MALILFCMLMCGFELKVCMCLYAAGLTSSFFLLLLMMLAERRVKGQRLTTSKTRSDRHVISKKS